MLELCKIDTFLSLLSLHYNNSQQDPGDMKDSINYPKLLDPIFQKLLANGAYPLLIGGFVRDSLLNRTSKDIDIEVYKIKSYTDLEKILAEFGSVCTVGKSFGVCKLLVQDLDLDFTLPRVEKKIASGHKGFEICIDTDLAFTQATRRRDFTINAIAYDIQTKKILDPFKGREDLQNKILRAVDPQTFVEDPLRVMRALQFCARFELTMENKLFHLCQEMIGQKALDELPAPRVFQELKKLLLAAKKPSLGLHILRKLPPFTYFEKLIHIDHAKYQKLAQQLDYLAQTKCQKEEKKLLIALGVLSYPLASDQEREVFLQTLTAQKNIHTGVATLLSYLGDLQSLLNKKYTDFDLYTLATKVCIKELVFFAQVLHYDDLQTKIALFALQEKAQKLKILHQPLKPLLQGRDLISLGLQSSQKFKSILDDAYKAQMKGLFSSHKEALLWLENYLSSIE